MARSGKGTGRSSKRRGRGNLHKGRGRPEEIEEGAPYHSQEVMGRSQEDLGGVQTMGKAMRKKTKTNIKG